jgi:transcriptional regulator GlxA family with amidase domain
MALSAALEPLRSVNRLTNQERYIWNMVGLEPGEVAASNGLEVMASFGLADAPLADLTIVVASLRIETFRNRALFGFLRSVKKQQKLIGAISNGPLILARAGLLAGRRVTIHWEMQQQLSEEFPNVNVTDNLFCRDVDVLTCGGGTASMDMMLDFIGMREGFEVAANVSEQFLHGPVRTSTELQRQDVRWRYGLSDGRLEAVIQMMEAQLENPARISKLAELAEVSERQLERLFHGKFGKSPSAFYLELRLKAAWARLLSTTETLGEIADAVGFSSQAHFSRAMKNWSGQSPLAIRKESSVRNGGSV